MSSLPDILSVWNFSDPTASEQAFRNLIPIAQEKSKLAYKYELITQIARTYSLRSQFDEAHELLDSIQDKIEIEAIVHVRYLLERGRTFNSADEKTEASALFLKAWDIAKTNQLDYLAVDAAHMLGISESSPDNQIKWTQTALDYAEASQQADAKKWLGSLYNNLGWSYHDTGDYQRALAIFEKGVQFRKEQGNFTSLRIAKWTVARALRSLERYEDALSHQKSLLIERQATGDEDGFVYEEIGENLIALNRDDEAKSYFADAYRLLKGISWIDADRLARIQSLSK